MKTTSLDRDLRSLIDAFADDLGALIRQSALAALNSVIGGAPVPRATAAASPATAPQRASKAKGGIRTPEEVLEVASTFFAYIESHPGERLDQIAKGLDMPSKELKLPVQKLFAQNVIKTRGVKRGTVYFVK